MHIGSCNLQVRSERVAIERSWVRYILAFACLVPSALLNAHAYLSAPAPGVNLPYLVAVPAGLFGFILALTSPNLVRLAAVSRDGVIRVTDTALIVDRNRRSRRWDLQQIVDAWLEPWSSTESSMSACVIRLRHGVTLRVALRSSDEADRLLHAVSCHPTERCAKIEIPSSASPIASAMALVVVGLLAGPFLILALILLQACFVGNDSPPKTELAVSGAIAALLSGLFLFVLKRLRPSVVSLGTDGVLLSGAQSLFLPFDHVTDVMTMAGEIVFVLSDRRYARIPSYGTPGAAVMRRVGELRDARAFPRELAAVAARLGRGRSRVPAWRARLEALDDIPTTYRDPLLSTAILTTVACAAEYPDDVRTGAAFLLARRRAPEGLRRVALAVKASVRPGFRRQLEAAAAGFLEAPSSRTRAFFARLSRRVGSRFRGSGAAEFLLRRAGSS